jgi:outer membrane protein OmpA-like peptidoglycan-associated protein/tetratricopeptide (TPR) repeat protein
MKKLYLLFIVFGISSEALAQHGQRAYEVLADSLYKHHNYKEATYYYKRAIKNANEPGNVMLKIARAFTEMKRVKEAEAWYEKARANKASFSIADTYYYVKELIMLKRRTDAEMVLSEFIRREPEAAYARQLLADVQNVNQYVNDSSLFQVVPLSVNTTGSEFAPSYYQNGLVFTSARPQFFAKRRYHWDNTPFLNLYYAAKTGDQNFQKPTLFEKYTNTRLHDGPVSFYASNSRMMLNRNVSRRMEAGSDIYISHLTIFDVSLDEMKKADQLTPLPFEHGAYSFAHPHISEDGNTLYFISDKPGGYGGTDIYCAVRQKEGWSKPFNLGPSINTPQNETFPFFCDNTLYFASDGHYGLGGMDLFKSKWSVNGFDAPVNLGYPINSNLDDFSLITKDHKTGYLASSRKGNDDLYAFTIYPKKIKLLARLCDGITNESLPDGTIQLLRNEEGDLTLTSGKGGKISYELPDESPYILIANREGKTGVLTGVATRDEDFEHMVHQLPVFGDSSSTTCVISLKNESGKPQNVSSAVITDLVNGQKLKFSFAQSLLTFQGVKGHPYQVAIQSESGNKAVQEVSLAANDLKVKTWNMTVKDTPELSDVSVHVLEEGGQSPIAGAAVQVSTLAAPDQEGVTDVNGDVTFRLPLGAAYLLVALKDSVAGMDYGFVEKSPDSTSNKKVIYLKRQKKSGALAMAWIKNAKGETLNDAKVTVTDKDSGEIVPLKTENGVLQFLGDPSRKYLVQVAHDGYNTITKEIALDSGEEGINKVSIVLPATGVAIQQLAVRVVSEKIPSGIAGALVTINRFSLQNLQLVSNEEGLVYFSVPEGEAYIASATKEGSAGVYMGTADTPTVIHSILIGQEGNGLQVNGKVSDNHGAIIPDSKVDVTDIRTGNKLPVEFKKGMLHFLGEPGAKYNITVTANEYSSAEKTITATSSDAILAMPALTLNKKIPVKAKVGNAKGEILKGALVRVIDETTRQPVEVTMEDGTASFLSEQGKSYQIIAESDDYNPVEDELIVPLLSEEVKPFYISMGKKTELPPSHLVKVRLVRDLDSTAVAGTEVKVMSFASDDIELTSATDGMVEFNIPKGSAYVTLGGKPGDYYGVYSGIAENNQETNGTVHILYLKKESGIPVFGFVSDAARRTLSNAKVVVTDNTTQQLIEARIENSIVIFNAQKGGSYKVEVTADGYETQTSNVSIQANASSAYLLDITISRKKLLMLPTGSSLVIVNNENPKVYITSSHSLDEIIEVNGQLFVENKNGKSLIGKGSMQELLTKPSYLIDFATDQKVNIDNVYFDYNSILLDDPDQQVLSKVKELFVQYPLLNVHVNTHADTRGSANYNLGLTNKRARVIKRHLIKQGIPGRHISTKAHGKNRPIVICETKECTELQHQRNRRAEFELSANRKARTNTVLQQQSEMMNAPDRGPKIAGYNDVLAKYGNVQMQGLVFKICIGAYRLNPNVKFPELSDLGSVTQHLKGSINFYFLQSYPTLNAAEVIRKKLNERGFQDAYITYFYKQKLITFKQFTYLAQ